MRLIGWLKRGRNETDTRRRQWRDSWSAAIESAEIHRLPDLRSGLASLRADGDDLEIELEMIDALEQLGTVSARVTAGGLPLVETQHRVIGAEPCHFTAPASLPTDPSQPSGRVLFTPTRSLFVAAGKTSILPWHAAQHIVRRDRDLLLARADGASGVHFRFNCYGDAVVAAFLARELKRIRAARVL